MTEDHRGDARLNRGFVGIATFLRAAHCPDLERLDADIAVLGVPTDEGSPFMAGARFAPRSLREHSLRFGTGGYYDIESDKTYLAEELSRGRLVDVGDVDVLPTNVEGTFDKITEAVGRILARGALPVVLGGDHAITFPVVRAFTRPLHVVHFDAHLDYGAFKHGLRYTNGQAFRLLRPLPQVESLTQVGIRSLRNQKSDAEDSRADGNRIITMAGFRELGPAGLAALLPEEAPCYVSIDVDVLDMALIPGCVSGEPNGMSYADLRDSLAALARRVEVIGFDFVEVNPQLDVATGATSYLGAHTVIQFLGEICDQPRWRGRRG